MNQLHDHLAQLPAQTQARIEDICEEFEVAWQARKSPSLVETAQSLDGRLRTILLRELLQIEQHYRSQSLGRPVTDEELIQSHAALADEIRRELPLIQRDETKEPTDTEFESPDGRSRQSSSSPPNLFEHFPAPFGRYRILGALGTGGMGSVFLAEDTKLERRVALKLPRIDASPNAQLVARFYQEAKAAAAISHPHLCEIYDVGEVTGRHYLSMEYIEGEPLSSRIKSNKPISDADIASLVHKLASALEEAHERGVVHRDLKPSNVMINHRGEPVITDFGLAQRSEQKDIRLTQSGEILGTPAYMSPEQVDGKLDNVGPATDVYSLGAILYELLSGRQPFQGSTASVLGQIMTADPSPIHEIRPAVDPVLAAICRKMMAKRIEERFASMQEVIVALAAWIDSGGKAELPVLADVELVKGSSDRKRSARHPRPPFRAGLIAVSVVALVLCGVVFLVRTPTTTFRVEVNDPRVRVVVDEQTLELTDGIWNGKQKAGAHQLAVMIGKQRLSLGEATTVSLDGLESKVRLSVSGIELVSDRFEIARDGETCATIEVAWEEVHADGTTIADQGLATSRELANRRTPVDSPDEESMSAADLLATGEWEWQVEKNLGPPINSLAIEYSADMTADGLTIVFSRRDDEGTYALWMATRPSIDDSWTEPVKLTSAINSHGSEAFPILSEDGLTLIFSRGVVGVKSFISTRASIAAPWSNAVPDEDLGGVASAELSADGLTLLATKNTGPTSGRDLVIGRRSSRLAAWSELTPVGTPVNTADHELSGTLSENGRLLIFYRLGSSESKPAKSDLLMATRADWDSPWSKPIPVFSEVHRGEQAPRLLPDGRTFLFSSSRPGGKGWSDIWLAKLVRKQRYEKSVAAP